MEKNDRYTNGKFISYKSKTPDGSDKIIFRFSSHSNGSENMRRLLLSNTLNTRDLGGHSIGGGKITTYNAFLRSDVPHIIVKLYLGRTEEQKLELTDRIVQG